MPSIRRYLLIFSALASMLAMSVSAQGSGISTEFDGLDGTYSRQYAKNPSETLDLASDEPFMVSARIFAFDSDDHAKDAWKPLLDVAHSQMTFDPSDDSVDLKEDDVDDLGDQAHAIWLHASIQDGATGYFRMLVVRDGANIFLVSTIAGAEKSTALADDMAAFMVEHEPGEGDGTVDVTGGSTGGLWELFPKKGDPVLGDLAPYEDAATLKP